MQPVTYRLRRSVVRNAMILYFCLGTLCIGFAIRDFSHIVLRAGYGSWWDAVTGLVLTLGAVACVIGAGRLFRHGSVDQNFLLLDGDSLTYSLWGVRRQWPWRHLSSFRVTKTFIFGHKVIRFSVPDAADWKARLRLRPGIKVSSGKIVVLISDMYDAPVHEIAGQLNECRETAIH